MILPLLGVVVVDALFEDDDDDIAITLDDVVVDAELGAGPLGNAGCGGKVVIELLFVGNGG